jgi:glycosyltransferase involved in cell wall biosynthesis
MRVYYVTSGLRGCYNVRCLLPLMENGWDGDTTSFLDNTEKSPQAKTAGTLDAEVVVFHRPENPKYLELARHLKEAGKKIVFDNDDTYKDNEVVKINEYIDQERVDRGLKAINASVDTFIKEADLVTCSTEFLADEYRKINKNVVVLPNTVDPFFFDEPLRNEGDKVRIGITGSVGLTADLDVLAPIFKHYAEDDRVQLVFFSLYKDSEKTKMISEIYVDEFKTLDELNVEWHGLTPAHEYYDKLNSLRLDIQIIPRVDSYFTRCKSNIKFLESSMLEIPVVAQGFEDGKSPYQGKDEPYMLIAKNQDEWIKQIDKLIENKELRREMGRKAREYVETEYSIENNAHKWEEAYKTIL